MSREKLTLDVVRDAVTGTAAAFRRVTGLQPVGGPGDKIFPPTYEGAKYALEKRRLPHETELVDCVLLDSVQSQANRMEAALLDAWEAGRISLPILTVDFSDHGLGRIGRITTLEMPHRIADAILRDSFLNKKAFRKTDFGKRLDAVDVKNAVFLFELCPTALIFGMWDSTGPGGASGAKFARAIVSEIVGFHARTGVRTSSRIDPLPIKSSAGPLYEAPNTEDIHWTLNGVGPATDAKKKPKKKGAKGSPSEAESENNAVGGDAQQQESKKIGEKGAPSEANLGNIVPSIHENTGGVTISLALQTTVISLPALRRLRFPLSPQKRNVEADNAARTVLAALALCSAELAREAGYDLRSRCQLAPTGQDAWELLESPGSATRKFAFSAEGALGVFNEALLEAEKIGLPWHAQELVFQPAPQLVELVRKSLDLAARQVEED